MKRWLLCAAAMLTWTTSVDGGNTRRVFINEVLYDPVGADGGNQLIEIINLDTAAVNMSTWAVCIQFNYRRFPTTNPLPIVQPGGTYTIHVNATGSNTPTDMYTGLYVNINPDSDSVGLYHNFVGFGTPANMEDFVQFGRGGRPRENVAVAAGLWTTGQFVQRAPEGQSLAYNGRRTQPPDILPHPLTDYRNETPTIGQNNSFYQLERLVINEVLADPLGPEAGATLVELYNEGLYAAHLSGLQWSAHGMNGVFPIGFFIRPNRYAVLHLNANGTNTSTDIYTGAGAAPDLQPAGGSLSVFKNSADFGNPDNMVDFVQWGASGQANETVADAALQWTAGDFIAQVVEGHSYGYKGSGNASTDWCDEDPPTPGARNACPFGSLANLRINEVLANPTGPDSSGTRVELINDSSQFVYLDGLHMGAQFLYYEVPAAGLLVPPGGLVVCHLNETGTNTATDIFTGPLVDLNETADAFVLYGNGLDYSDPDNMIDFFQWGAGGQPREDVAVAKGIWTAGAFFPEVLEGASMQWRGTGTSDEVDDYCGGDPTLAAPNVCPTTGVPEPAPEFVMLGQNQPNPFGATTRFHFTLTRREDRLELTVYDILGTPVRRLLKGAADPGVFDLGWDGRDDLGRPVASGLYLYVLKTSDRAVTRKMILSR